MTTLILWKTFRMFAGKPECFKIDISLMETSGYLTLEGNKG